MSAHIIGGITVDLSNGPVRTEYSRGYNGRHTARLVIGEGSTSIGIAVSESPAATLAQLEAAVAELSAWVARRNLDSARQVA